MHHFHLDEHTVLWKMTYTNLTMYLASVPHYDGGDEGETSKEVSKIEKLPGAPSREAVRNFFKTT